MNSLFRPLLAASIVASLALPAGLVAQQAVTLERATQIAESDVQAAVAELNRIESQIQSERSPISARLEQLEAEALRKRTEANRVATISQNSTFNLQGLQNRLQGDRDTNTYLRTLLTDYINRFETSLHVAELQLHEAALRDAKNTDGNTALSDKQKFEVQLAVVDRAFERLDQLIGGHSFKGKAVVGGLEETGDIVLLGPLAAFASATGTGVIENLVNVGGKVIPVPVGEEGLRQLATTGKGSLPLDATLGDAGKLALTEESLPEHIKKGGLTMIPIIGIGVVALLIFFFKIFEIRSVTPARSADVDAVLAALKAGKKDEAARIANGVKGPAGDLLRAAVEHASSDRELLEEALYEKIISVQPKLDRFTPFIAIAAATAPLLGLLGTVTGMISTFKLITVFGTGDARRLSSGISEALITTEWGLIIAIPALILHAILTRLARSRINSMEQNAVNLINGMAAGR